MSLPISAFVAGMVGFLTAPVLLLAPAYLGVLMFYGTSPEQLKASGAAVPLPRIFGKSVAFLIGFYMMVGAFIASPELGIVARIGIVEFLAGGYIVVFGLHVLGVVKIPPSQDRAEEERPQGLGDAVKTVFKKLISIEHLIELVTELPLHLLPESWEPVAKVFFTSFGGAVVLGLLFALEFVPTVGPILAVILSALLESGGRSYGIFLASVYCFGLAIPFLLISLGVPRFLAFYARSARRSRVIEITLGVWLVAIGITIAFGEFYALSTSLSF